ncbi:hypothetical protein PG993_004341 [Apiospora rasikravindrae]|uniref:Secreted protein n=1 Tax=Apiospora rasikravindrae TaxID=990691 RepID=A0ABR1TD32_9PEZI
MLTKTVNLALLWAFLCCALAAFAEAESLPNEDNNGHSNLANRGIGKFAGPGIRWKLAIEEGGPIMEFNGTLQQVKKQIQALNPDFEFTPVPPANTITHNRLDTRRTCLDPYINAAEASRIQDDINYLRGLGDTMCGDHGGSDGSNCGQISCNWNSAIKWCNKGPNYYETKCSAFADYAQDILINCNSQDVGSVERVHGQEEDTASDHDFLVVVEASEC